MADSGDSVTILPSGEIGLCEHYTETEFIGHIDHTDFDLDVVKDWKTKVDEIEECNTCFYFPNCFLLKKCTSNSICYPYFRSERLRNTRRTMLHVYNQWLSKNKTGDGSMS